MLEAYNWIRAAGIQYRIWETLFSEIFNIASVDLIRVRTDWKFYCLKFINLPTWIQFLVTLCRIINQNQWENWPTTNTILSIMLLEKVNRDWIGEKSTALTIPFSYEIKFYYILICVVFYWIFHFHSTLPCNSGN